jgi:branched-chain amino acid transport system permease protein
MWALRYPQIISSWESSRIQSVHSCGLRRHSSVQGAMIGGLLLGFIEIMIIAFFRHFRDTGTLLPSCCLIMILFVKPTGLMGEKLEDKI